MARAKTRTWLPIDRWFEIIGIHPFHANQLISATYMPSLTCGSVWFQYSWQDASRISREDIAMAISMAEIRIANEVGYNLLPDWIPLGNGSPERLRFDRPGLPELFSRSGTTVRGQLRSIQLRKGWVIGGGKRVKTGIETAIITRSDEDGDGYSETCTVTVGTSVTDPDEIKLYYPGESGADEWEIRPITVSISASVATIKFKVWQVVDPDLQEALDAASIDAETALNFLTTVDVYRVYNDPQTQVQMLFEEDGGLCACNSSNCIACQLDTQGGCLYKRDERLGIVSVVPATWSSSDSAFSLNDWTACRAPDQARIYYYSGWQDPQADRPKSDMDPFWEKAVAYYAASLLEKDGCDCSNAMEFIYHMRSDVSRVEPGKGSWVTTIAQLSNRLGTTKGALYAINNIAQPGIRLGGR